MKASTVSRVMRAMGKRGGKAGGRKGGVARMSALTPKQRKELARKAAAARWGKPQETLSEPEPPSNTELKQQIRFIQFMEQAKQFDYRDWKPTVSYGTAKSTPDSDLLEGITRETFRFLALDQDTLGILPYRFIRTCEQLKVPEEKWPTFARIVIPDPAQVRVEMPPFVPPSYDALRDSGTTWRRIAGLQWSKYCKVCLAKVRKQIHFQARTFSAPILLAPQKQRRETGTAASLAMRLEWAVLHYCEKWSYGRIFNSPKYNPNRNYSRGQVTKATQAILAELELRQPS